MSDESRTARRWMDRSDRKWPVEVIASFEYDKLNERNAQLEATIEQWKIVHASSCAGHEALEKELREQLTTALAELAAARKDRDDAQQLAAEWTIKLCNAESQAARVREVAEKMIVDRVISGSPGPLFNAGWAAASESWGKRIIDSLKGRS